MAAESIINLRKPGFPKIGKSENGATTTIEYIGATATLTAAVPSISTAWGDYLGTVKSTSIAPVENSKTSGISVLTVETELPIDNETIETGTLRSISYEIRWVTVSRSLLEHPQFAIGQGGANALTDEDIAAIELWKSPENGLQNKKNFLIPSDDEYDPSEPLSTNARLFARGLQLGQETWEDKAPVVAKISEYVGGPPPETDAGAKNTPTGFPNLPSGYEWRKETADSTRAGGETRWNLTEEWVGAKKILSDKNAIYWSAPT